MSLEVVSIHFPKAGGSSLAEGLRRHFGEALALDYTHDPVNPDHLHNEPARVAPGIRAVHGHFRGDRYAAHQPAFRFTFLREPVSNVISIYYFWRSFPPSGSAPHERLLREQPSIFDFVEHCSPIRRLMSQTYFGGIDVGAFDFVGFHETRERDLARLSALLGTPFSNNIHLNATTNAEIENRRTLMEDAGALATLRSLLADDVAFYEAARNRWD